MEHVSQARAETQAALERQRLSRESVLAKRALEQARFWDDLATHADHVKESVNTAVGENDVLGFNFAGVVHDVKLPDDSTNETGFSIATELTDAITDYVKSEVEREGEESGVKVDLAREVAAGTEDDPSDYYRSVFAVNWPKE